MTPRNDPHGHRPTRARLVPADDYTDTDPDRIARHLITRALGPVPQWIRDSFARLDTPQH